MFKTLVVALDLEDDGDRALPAVQALATACGARHRPRHRLGSWHAERD